MRPYVHRHSIQSLVDSLVTSTTIIPAVLDQNR